MKSMFMNCDSLKEINLFKFNTENVNNMSYMFYNRKSSKNLYITFLILILVNRYELYIL